MLGNLNEILVKQLGTATALEPRASDLFERVYRNPEPNALEKLLRRERHPLCSLHAMTTGEISNRHAAAYPAMERYMIRIGRRKLIVPLYRDLAATPEGLSLAARIYARAREGYHPMAQATVDGILKPTEQ